MRNHKPLCGHRPIRDAADCEQGLLLTLADVSVPTDWLCSTPSARALPLKLREHTIQQ
jgi:hypothetical protein